MKRINSIPILSKVSLKAESGNSLRIECPSLLVVVLLVVVVAAAAASSAAAAVVVVTALPQERKMLVKVTSVRHIFSFSAPQSGFLSFCLNRLLFRFSSWSFSRISRVIFCLHEPPHFQSKEGIY